MVELIFLIFALAILLYASLFFIAGLVYRYGAGTLDIDGNRCYSRILRRNQKCI